MFPCGPPAHLRTALTASMAPSAAGHAMFAHHGWLGRREDAQPFAVEVQVGGWTEGTQCSATLVPSCCSYRRSATPLPRYMRPQGGVSLEGGFTAAVGSSNRKMAVRERRLSFRPPCFVSQTIVPGALPACQPACLLEGRVLRKRMIAASLQSYLSHCDTLHACCRDRLAADSGGPTMHTCGYAVPSRPGWCLLITTSYAEAAGSGGAALRAAVGLLPRWALHLYTQVRAWACAAPLHPSTSALS